MGIVSAFPGGAGGDVSFVAIIQVTFTAGSTLTCAKGATAYTAAPEGDRYAFKVFEAGTWTVTATMGGEETSQTVEIVNDGQYAEADVVFVRIYGIRRDITAQSPAWTRTDNAAGLTATASVGAVAGASDFDAIAPWSGIRRETLSTGDVMVRIPKFWFRRYREGNLEHIQIANNAAEGFAVHPLFVHAGTEADVAYVGAYKTTGDNRSLPGSLPTVSVTRANFRVRAANKGEGWGLIDIAALSAIQMLILVEFANNNVQAVIGRGYCDANSSRTAAGTCDGVPNLTGRPAGIDGKVDVVWRGIEGLWGNAWEWVDGVNYNAGTYYVCNDPSIYADDTATDYTGLSYVGKANWSASYITQEGLDSGGNSYVFLPETAGGGSESTHECDACWSSSSGWNVFCHGGSYENGSRCGLFATAVSYPSLGADKYVGSRLLYLPQGGA
jgi:hypothetical protein